MLAKRLTKANRSLIDKPKTEEAMADYNDGSFKENYIYIRESGLLWSSTVLAPRLKQP